MQFIYVGQMQEVHLVDDGTLDTVLELNGREVRYDQEYAALFREKDGTLSNDGMRRLAVEALDEGRGGKS